MCKFGPKKIKAILNPDKGFNKIAPFLKVPVILFQCLNVLVEGVALL